MSSASSSDGAYEGPTIIPTTATENMDTLAWQERSVFVGGLPETHRSGMVCFQMVKALVGGPVTSIRNGSSGSANPHFACISFQSPALARRCAELLKTPSPIVPPGLQPSAVTLDHVEFARGRVGRPFFPPGAALPNAINQPRPLSQGPRTSLPPQGAPTPPPPSVRMGGPPTLVNGQPLTPYGVGGVGKGFGSGNGHGHMGGPPALNPNFDQGPHSYTRASTEDRRVESPAANQRGGMRSDAFSSIPPQRIPSSNSSGDVKVTLPPSPDANTRMRAFPPSPDKGSPSTLPPVPTRSPSLHRPTSPPRSSSSTPMTGISAPPGPLAPLPASLFTPPTSAEDLAAKLRLAEAKLAELTVQGKLAEQKLDLVKQAAKRKEAEQERELATLRRELEGAKRHAVELQMKAGVTQRLVERMTREDDKIGISLSLIENLAHRARINPGPQGVLPPVPGGYDLSRIGSSPSRASSTILSHLPSSARTSSSASSSSKRRDHDRDYDETDRDSKQRRTSSRPDEKTRPQEESREVSSHGPSSDSASSSAVASLGSKGDAMVLEAARREAESRGVLGLVGKAFSFFSHPPSSTGAPPHSRDVKMEYE